MVAGGFAVAGNRISEIEDQIAILREDAGITSEFHWSEYRGGRKREAYEALIRYGFDLVHKRKAALHVIIVRFSGYNHRANKGDNRDTSINRMYYQLFLHRILGFMVVRAPCISGWMLGATAKIFAICAISFALLHTANIILVLIAFVQLSQLTPKTSVLFNYLTLFWAV